MSGGLLAKGENITCSHEVLNSSNLLILHENKTANITCFWFSQCIKIKRVYLYAVLDLEESTSSVCVCEPLCIYS
jgi:hypothetical protein